MVIMMPMPSYPAVGSYTAVKEQGLPPYEMWRHYGVGDVFATVWFDGAPSGRGVFNFPWQATLWRVERNEGEDRWSHSVRKIEDTIHSTRWGAKRGAKRLVRAWKRAGRMRIVA